MERHDGETKVALRVEGMRCAGCAGVVTRALSKVRGVSDVRVDLEGGRAEVRKNRGVSASDLVVAVEQAGYRASLN